MRGFQLVKDEYRVHNYAELPTRADNCSAGYDFKTPVDLVIRPKQSVIFKTDIKAYMWPDEVLMMYVRSSIGVKKHLMLLNGTGVIDSSFYNNLENDGNISIGLYNYGTETVIIKAGDRVVQGVFIKYLTADTDICLSDKRIGGIGSSGE